MKAISLVVLLVGKLLVVAAEKYMEWGCRSIRFAEILRCMSMVSLCIWMLSKINIFGWSDLSPSDVHNQLLSFSFWGFIGALFISRLIAGIWTNVELTNRRVD